MIDKDLAELYQVETRILNQAVKRNIEHFPEKFRFQLTQLEFDEHEKSLKFQFGTSNETNESLISKIEMSKENRGGRRYLPYGLPEEGQNGYSSGLAINKSDGIVIYWFEMW